MSSQMEEVIREIEYLRRCLYDSIEKSDNLSYDVIDISEKLDKLLIKYYELLKNQQKE